MLHSTVKKRTGTCQVKMVVGLHFPLFQLLKGYVIIIIIIIIIISHKLTFQGSAVGNIFQLATFSILPLH